MKNESAASPTAQRHCHTHCIPTHTTSAKTRPGFVTSTNNDYQPNSATFANIGAAASLRVRDGVRAGHRIASCISIQTVAPSDGAWHREVALYKNSAVSQSIKKPRANPGGIQRRRLLSTLNSILMTPYEKFKSLPQAEQFLKPGITFRQLDTQANAMSDNEAARRLNRARATMFKTIYNRSKSAA